MSEPRNEIGVTVEKSVQENRIEILRGNGLFSEFAWLSKVMQEQNGSLDPVIIPVVWADDNTNPEPLLEDLIEDPNLKSIKVEPFIEYVQPQVSGVGIGIAYTTNGQDTHDGERTAIIAKVDATGLKITKAKVHMSKGDIAKISIPIASENEYFPLVIAWGNKKPQIDNYNIKERMRTFMRNSVKMDGVKIPAGSTPNNRITPFPLVKKR